jgi:hypothetical protein
LDVDLPQTGLNQLRLRQKCIKAPISSRIGTTARENRSHDSKGLVSLSMSGNHTAANIITPTTNMKGSISSVEYRFILLLCPFVA